MTAIADYPETGGRWYLYVQVVTKEYHNGHLTQAIK
jgi:hypothetical protein